MSIDPNTLPDGTVVETNDGNLHFKDGDGRQVVRGRLGDGDPYPWRGRTIVRTYTPDPTPDQEVPRDEWANIAVGSRVRIVEVDGDEHTVTLYVTDEPWLWATDHGYDGAKIVRIYLLDAPTPPPPPRPRAGLGQEKARAAWETQEGGDWADVSDGMRRAGLNEARAALAIVRGHEAES